MMKGLLWLLTLAAVLPVNVVAQSDGSSAAAAAASSPLSALLAQLPHCAINCLEIAIPNSTCAPTDQQCICTNVPLNNQINSCVQLFCTVKEALVTKNVTSIGCNAPMRDRRGLYEWISNVFVIATWVAFILRILSRYLSETKFWWDDLTIALVMVSIFSGLGVVSILTILRLLEFRVQSSMLSAAWCLYKDVVAHNGLGKDIWTLTFKNISDVIHVFFAAELLYFAQMSLIKISILFFYLRLFPETLIRRFIHGTIIFNAMTFIVFDLLGLFQCRPINFYWERWDGEHKGVCLNINALAFTNAGISIVVDFWMLLLPLTQLFSLKLHWKRKIGVALMLSVGIRNYRQYPALEITCPILEYPKSNILMLVPGDYVSVGYWSTIEICVGIICSCMPALRLLLVYVFPSIRPSQSDSKSASKSGSNSRTRRLGYDPNRRRTGSKDHGLQSCTSCGGAGVITYHKSFDVISTRGNEAEDMDIEMEGMGKSKGLSDAEGADLDDDAVDLVGKNWDMKKQGDTGWV
ncbi:CFEM domain-containing protein [Rutstroemia sp. NJR-2017a BBW]|nr:CFEM domain-containing protein [Rutstroemia sp. NJR-2017a BBW]